MLDVGIRGVFALPVSLSYECVGVLRGVTATELAWEVVERRVSLDSPDWHDLGWPAGVAS